MKVTMRFVGGPYAGQTVLAPLPRYQWTRGRGYQGPIPYLVKVWGQGRLCCYLTVPNDQHRDTWHLAYQKEFE